MIRTAPTPPAPTARTSRRRHRATLLTVLVAALLTVLGTAGPATAAEICTPGETNGCVGGTIRTAAGDPAAGVVLSVTGTDGVALPAVTGEDGKWAVTVAAAGDYTVLLDVASLPAGETLRDPDKNPRVVTVRLGATAAALFPLGEPSASTPAPSSSASAAPSTDTGSSDGGGTAITFARVAQQAVNGLIFGVLLALASVGLSLLYGTTGLSNFAHGEQVTLGAILAYVGTQILGMPLVLAGISAVVLGAASGWLQDAGIWHPLRKRRVGNTQQMIVTIGFSMVLQYGFQFFFGGSRLRLVIANPVPVHLGPVIVSQQSLISMVLAAVTLGGVAWFLIGTRVGRATRAVSDNPALASASGISVERIIRLVWTAGAGLAALGGVLIALYFNSTSWNMGGTILLLMFAAVTLGGLGTAYGALAGSLVIGLVAEMSSLVIPSDMRYAGALLILIIVLLVRPQGILGRAERVG